MKYLLLLNITFWSLIPVAQNTVESYIKDHDGYTNVRKEQSATSEILTIIKNAELFECTTSHDSNWWKIKTKSGTTGYVHKSRIVTVEDQATKVEEFFNKILASNPNDVEFGEVSNELLFQFAERFPKSFILAFDRISDQTQKLIIKELESPIHDGIDVELIFERLSKLEVNTETKELVVNAVLIAARKSSKSAISH